MSEHFVPNIADARRVVLWTLLIAWQLARGICGGEPETYIGRASCAAATCHGGISGQGPAWNSSLRTWEATDAFHAGAGRVLMNDQSQRMLQALARGLVQTLDSSAAEPDAPDSACGEAEQETAGRVFDDSGSPTSKLFDSILRERCVVCHAPTLTARVSNHNAHGPDWQRAIHEGVNCEACHGPASNWLTLHTQRAASIHSLAEGGMLATQPWLERTDNCLRCHLGSRTANGGVRDVNHDLIAAGHPALRFEMSQYQFTLPAHWAIAASQKVQGQPPQMGIDQDSLNSPPLRLDYELPSPGQHHAARLRTLAAAASLSLERQAASDVGQAPSTELAEYHCNACHQSISVADQATEQIGHGKFDWNRIYTEHTWQDGDAWSILLTSLPADDRELTNSLTWLRAQAYALSETVVQADQRQTGQDEFRFLQPIPALGEVSNYSFLRAGKPDWQLAASWLWANRLMLLNALPPISSDADPRDRLSAELAATLAELLDEFEGCLTASGSGKQSLLGMRIEVSDSDRVDFERLFRLRDQFRQKLSEVESSTRFKPVTGDSP